jgi:ABC-type multidrug transport system ATPase subunit
VSPPCLPAADVSYVPQRDIMDSHLTVRECVFYTGRWRVPELSEDELDERVNRVLHDLELTEHARKKIGAHQKRAESPEAK